MFQLAHAALLRVHLFKALILGELGHELVLEFALQALLLSLSLFLQAHLEFLGLLEFLSNGRLFLHFHSFLLQSGLFLFLHVKFVTEVLKEFLLGAARFFFSGQLL